MGNKVLFALFKRQDTNERKADVKGRYNENSNRLIQKKGREQLRSKKLKSRMAKKMGVLLLTAAITGGSVGQSVYASAGVPGDNLKLTTKRKIQRAAKDTSATIFQGDLMDKDGNKSGVSWSVNTETGVLSLTGKGVPYISTDINSPVLPWTPYNKQITKITIDEGVKPENMDYWFCSIWELKEVPKLPDSLKSAKFTFMWCYGLEKAPELPDSLKVADGMFYGDELLKEAPELPEGLESAAYMFLNCVKLTKIKGAKPIGIDTPDPSKAAKMFQGTGVNGLPTKVWYKGNWEKLKEWSKWQRKLVYFCKVKFQNADRQISQEIDVDQGNEMTMGQVPKAPKGYHWNAQDLEKIRGKIKEDVLIRAEKENFLVEFKDWDGRVLNDQRVKYNERATAPASPARAGYTFIGWDKSFAKITGDTIITAQYRKNPNATKPETNSPAAVQKPSVSVSKKQTMAGKGFEIKVYRKIKGASVSFKTSNKKIASVSRSGYVKGLRAGKAMITTTVRQGGKTYSFRTAVTVKAYIKFMTGKKMIKKGKSYTFKAKAYGVNSKLKWSLSNKKIAKISKKGKFKAKKKGKVYVIVKSGKYQAKYLVRVK